jgi:tagatose 1,6-diphosphate aldolase
MPTTAQQADDDTVRSRFMAFLRAEIAAKPSIYLSAGVSNAQFVESLRMATEAGTDFSGVLCDRATWKEGIPVYVKLGAPVTA